MNTPLCYGLTISILSHAQAWAADPVEAFDGQWDMQLVCPSHQAKSGRVAEGYKISFPVSIKNGRLEGEQLNPPPDAGLRYKGTVDAKGRLTILAEGRSGNPRFTLGASPSGSPYRYSLEGHLNASDGLARRLEDRPCDARFQKVQ
jgi:hypothetical protein